MFYKVAKRIQLLLETYCFCDNLRDHLAKRAPNISINDRFIRFRDWEFPKCVLSINLMRFLWFQWRCVIPGVILGNFWEVERFLQVSWPARIFFKGFPIFSKKGLWEDLKPCPRTPPEFSPWFFPQRTPADFPPDFFPSDPPWILPHGEKIRGKFRGVSAD